MSDSAAYVIILGLLVIPAVVLGQLGQAIVRSIFLNQSVIVSLPFPLSASDVLLERAAS